MLVGERMTPRPITVNEDTSLPEALELMRKEKIRRLPVLDKHGKLVGIVTEPVSYTHLTLPTIYSV